MRFGALVLGVTILLSVVGFEDLHAGDDLRVVASTSWVGAMVEAAGASDLRVLAPVELRHPAEYDFSPRDIGFAAEADLLVWGGYESFMRNLFDAADIPDDRILQVRTSNNPPLMAEAVEAIAEHLGTEDRFENWKRRLNEVSSELLAAAEDIGTADIPVAVHQHQRGFAEWLGFTVVAEFGMDELTASRLRDILAQEPQIIIDNWHVPSGEPLRGEGREYASLINFPGTHGTADLLDVLRHNARELGLF